MDYDVNCTILIRCVSPNPNMTGQEYVIHVPD